jgi:hypothetical protein
LHQAALQRAFFFAASAASSAGVSTLLIDFESTAKPPRLVTCAAPQVPAPMWASPGADVGQFRRGCGPAPARMWASPGADVGQSRRGCGMGTLPSLTALMSAALLDFGMSNVRTTPPPPARMVVDSDPTDAFFPARAARCIASLYQLFAFKLVMSAAGTPLFLAIDALIASSLAGV